MEKKMLLTSMKTDIEEAIRQYREVSQLKLTVTDKETNQQRLQLLRQRIIDLNKQQVLQVELIKQLKEEKKLSNSATTDDCTRPSKDEVLKGIGLIPKKAYEDLCAQRSLRRHRSTANPKFAQRKELSRTRASRNRHPVESAAATAATVPVVIPSDESNDSKPAPTP